MLRPRLLIILILFFFLSVRPSYADISTWQKGFTLRINKYHTQTQVDAALNEMQEAGIDFVALSPGWITDSTSSTNVDRKSNTVTDELVKYTVTKAHSMGMRVMLKPHLDVKSGNWRASINPSDKNKFFQNYTNMLMTYANIAQETGAEQLSIGAELVVLTTNPNNTHYWQTLISKVRGAYEGDLIYSANGDPLYTYDEFGRLPFWQDLDYIGISFYRPMSKNNTPTVGSILTEWERYERDYIKPNQQKFQKPLIFTEIGYRSIDGVARMPWDYSTSSSVDTAEQKDLYTAFFEFWKDKSYMQGVNFWEWEMVNDIDPKTNKNYTPQNKPSEDVVKAYFSESGSNEPEPLPEEFLITSLNRYIRSTIKVGNYFYSDRNYTITGLPELLSNQEFILGKNSDKTSVEDNFLNFKLTKKAYVYIAYDARATKIPQWLSGFSKTGSTIKTTDAEFNIYQKEYAPGQIVLGGNLASPASGAGSNYFVMASEDKLEDITTQVPEPEIPIPTDPEDPGPTTPEDNPEPTPEMPEEENPIGVSITLADPKNGAVMDGEKKLKILIDELELSQYTSTYNVDNKGRVNMPNDSTGKYKQAKIDFETWDWNGRGPYAVLIEAQNLQGSLIATKTITLYVDH